MSKEQLLQELIERSKQLQYNDRNELHYIRHKGKMSLQNIFPTKDYFKRIENIVFKGIAYEVKPEAFYREEWEKGKTQLIDLLQTALFDLELQQLKGGKHKDSPENNDDNTNDPNIISKPKISQKKPITQLPFGISPPLFWSILVSIVGASYFIGNEIGGIKFDKEKLDYYNENAVLKSSNDSLMRDKKKLNELLNASHPDVSEVE